MTEDIKKSHEEIIQESHERSKEFGVEKSRVFPKKVLSEDELRRLLYQNKELMDIATPFLEELSDFLKGTGYILVLTDHEGCILRVMGDKKTISEAEFLNMVMGAYMSENSIGTNAMGTAISENAPVQVTADEHFVSAYHRWTCSAAPIHDTEGKIIGTINLTGDSQLMHPHSLGLVVAAVSAIENHIENIEIQKQLFDSNMYAFAMMNNLSYGAFAIDLNDDIHWVNDTACRALNIRRLNLINQPINNFFKDWPKVKKSVIQEIPYIDEEGQFQIENLDEKFLLNALPIKTKENELLGFLLTFRELSRMIKLVNKYTGSRARFTFADITENSKAIKSLVKNAKMVANSPSTILITGESGTGKEVFAQAIHNASERKDSGFVALNCGAITATLIESELFGYDDGAFTGAKKGGNPGKFELAHKGTLFLDEIGEMPPDMQIRLLRALQEGSITRIGSNKAIDVDVRIIAATNKNLEEEVKQGRFRLDLFYRLNIIHLHVPPLRERKEDILPFLRFFIRRKANRLKMNIPDIPKEIIDRVVAYHWPGNVRELENFAEKLILLQGKLTPEMMDEEFRTVLENKNTVQEPIENTIPALPAMFIPKSIEEAEKEIIEKTLQHFQNNMSQSAKSLAISRNTLYLKAKKYGITM